MKYDVSEFADMLSGINGVRFHGKTRGRAFFDGYAISVENLGLLLDVGSMLAQNDMEELAKKSNVQIDSLGFNHIVIFRERLFDPQTYDPDAYDPETDEDYS